ncbi:hypothetical protein D3C87_1588330 [compost metagenome]
MIALDVERAGLAFVAVQCAARNAWDFLIADHRFAVRHECKHSAHQRNVECVPFAGFFGNHFARGNETVDCAHLVEGGLHAFAVGNLHFVTAA